MSRLFGHDLEAMMEGGDEALSILRRKLIDAAAGTTLINKEDLSKLIVEFSALKAVVTELASRSAKHKNTRDR